MIGPSSLTSPAYSPVYSPLCNTQRHTATHCSTATNRNTPQHTGTSPVNSPVSLLDANVAAASRAATDAEDEHKLKNPICIAQEATHTVAPATPTTLATTTTAATAATNSNDDAIFKSGEEVNNAPSATAASVETPAMPATPAIHGPHAAILETRATPTIPATLATSFKGAHSNHNAAADDLLGSSRETYRQMYPHMYTHTSTTTAKSIVAHSDEVRVEVESKMCKTLNWFAKQPWIDVDTPSIGAHAMSELPSEGILSPPHTDREVAVLQITVHSHTITSHLARGGLLHQRDPVSSLDHAGEAESAGKVLTAHHAGMAHAEMVHAETATHVETACTLSGTCEEIAGDTEAEVVGMMETDVVDMT